ncbi:hypothetical protein [Nocardia transvalensis]|uniref:hypothetical protein n=1 Tax=Nocardia transvalensis TaxID=37333 RepID=UPI00189604B1|nr:hypothetical protein [Nocardia transvalensis]MBF6332220.1 hypothetical protein [Nocardia transvalensis]
MTADFDAVFDAFYRRLNADAEYRKQLIADPKATLCATSGYPPDDSFAVEVIQQLDNTMVMLLPASPQPGQDFEQRLFQTTSFVYDMLLTSGIGGFLIPDNQLKWTLRDMRSSWFAKAAHS